MLSMKKAVLSTVLLASAVLTSCAPYPHYGYGYRVPPPPGPAFGMVGRAPGRGFVWVEGFYDLRGSRWVWIPGYWVRPPRPGAVWVRPSWEPRGHGYHFHQGYWR